MEQQRVDGRGMPPVEIVDMRSERSALHPTTRVRRSWTAEGDRAAESPRLVELPGVRACGHAFGCPNCDVTLVLHRRRARSTATTAATPSRCPAAVRRAGRCRSRGTASGPSGSSRTSPSSGSTCCASMPTSTTPGAVLARFGELERAVLRRHAARRQGTRLPRRSTSRSCSSRRDPAVPRPAQRGADVRAHHAAGRGARARGERVTAACSSRPPHPSTPWCSPPARHGLGGLPRR